MAGGTTPDSRSRQYLPSRHTRYLVEILGLEAARDASQKEFQEASQEVVLPAE
jgi:hypothetical protein